MICIEGKTAFSGIAIGPIREFAKKSSAVRRSHVDDTAAECTRFEEAKKSPWRSWEHSMTKR